MCAADSELYRVFKQNGCGRRLAGFVDVEGTLKIPTTYDGALPFAEGLAAVGDPKSGKMGAIDVRGEWVVPPVFDKLFWFSEGLCQFKAGPLSGYIDRRGLVAIPPAFHDARDFHEGVAAVRTGHEGARYIRRDGSLVAQSCGPNMFRAADGLLPLHDEATDRFGYVDLTGATRIPPRFDFAREFSEGVAAVKPRDRREESPVGFIDRSGEFVVGPGPYIHAESFAEGFAAVTRMIRRRGKLGFINRKFEEAIPARFYLVERFSSGLAPAQLAENKPWGFINHHGEWAIPPQFSDVEPFAGSLARITTKAGQSGYVNRSGKIVWLDDPQK